MKSSILTTVVFLFIMIAIPISSAYAAIPTQVAPDVGTNVADYQFELLGYNPVTYIKFGTNFYSNGGVIASTYVNFTNAALAGNNYPTKSFGLGVKDGNATVTTINAGTLVLTMHCTASTRCDAFYYYSMPVQAITFNVNGVTTRVLSADFYTSSSAFASAATPAVYNNATGSYLQTKVTYVSPTTITVESGVFVYADLGINQITSTIRLYKPDASAIPTSINIYTSNDPNNWGTAVVSAYTLAQSTGYENINIPQTTARYVKLEVNVFGTANKFQVGEFNVMIVSTAPEGALKALDNVWMFYTTISSVLVIGVVVWVLHGRGYSWDSLFSQE